MDNLSHKKQNLIRMAIYFVMVFSLMHVFGLVIGVKLSIFLQIVVIVAGSSVIRLFIKKPMVLYVLLIIVFLSGILTSRYMESTVIDIIARSIDIARDITEYLRGKAYIKAENVLWIWGIQLGLTSLVTSWFVFEGKRIYWLLPLYLSFFIFYWYTYVDQAMWMMIVFLAAFFVLMGTNKFFRERDVWKSRGKNDFENLYRPWVRTVVAYSVLIVLIAGLLPKGTSFVRWQWLEQKVFDLFPIVEDMRGGNHYIRGTGQADFFNLASTGYQRDTGRLGGPVVLGDQLLMTVYTEEPVYLRGNVRHLYSGDSWLSASDSFNVYNLYEDFGELTEEEKDAYYQSSSVNIVHQLFSSKTLFSPYKPVSIEAAGNHDIVVYRDGVLIFPHGIFKGESYIVRIEKPLDHAELILSDIGLKKTELPNVEIYLNLPESITKRTVELTQDIVREAESDYEKAMVIEKYLRENYRYTLEGDDLPDGREFVDFFLFESEIGYCTYYATAMAVMLRLEGIPSRYVEGYVAQEKAGEGIYEVYQNNAHAWVEAFIEPVGWMTFEPTSSLPAIIRRDDHPGKPGGDNDSDDIDNGGKEPREDNDDIKIDDDDYTGGGGTPVPNGGPTIPFSVTKVILWLLALGITGFIPLKFLLGIMRFERFKKQLILMTNSKKVILLYQYITMLISESGYPPQDGETHYEFASRIAYKFHNQGEKSIKEITDIFVRSKYSRFSATVQDALDVESFSKTMENRLKNDWGAWTFYYRKYVTRDFIKDFKSDWN
ncbi:MAG: transglutaminaseTgpA domain-containing protein [Eubacteriales bacterium]|nr:transglutaminaseTgpA domain-containing protein [Eubacteriales bacterium]